MIVWKNIDKMCSHPLIICTTSVPENVTEPLFLTNDAVLTWLQGSVSLQETCVPYQSLYDLSQY